MTLTMLRMSSEASTTPAASMATSVPTPIGSPTSARARARASLTLSPAHCSHKKDQHGWQLTIPATNSSTHAASTYRRCRRQKRATDVNMSTS
jgi:hypothetical protein